MNVLEISKTELKNQQLKQTDLESKIFQTQEALVQAEESIKGFKSELAFVKGVIQSLNFIVNTLKAENVTQKE